MYTLDDLVCLMARLRDPEDGCPWDIKQDYRSITPSTLEEAYEVVDAIEREAYSDLKEELGDLLFQVVFYCRIAEEEERFAMRDVIDGLTAKLLRRHPHVFPDGSLQSRREKDAVADEGAIKQSWEAIKSQERKTKGKSGLMDDIPVALPAMYRAVKMQKRAAKAGFDWPDIQGVLEKLKEEITELEAAITHQDEENIAEEVGDLFFTCVNLARHARVNPEKSLRDANTKFYRRFHEMEDVLASKGKNMGEMESEALNSLWEEAKITLSEK